MLLKRYIFAAPLPHFLSILLHQYRTFCHFYRTTTALFGKIAGAVPHLFAQKTAPKHGPCRLRTVYDPDTDRILSTVRIRSVYDPDMIRR